MCTCMSNCIRIWVACGSLWDRFGDTLGGFWGHGGEDEAQDCQDEAQGGQDEAQDGHVEAQDGQDDAQDGQEWPQDGPSMPPR